MGPVVEGKDVIILTETHEHEGCKVPDFDSYNKVLVWNNRSKTGNGQGGSQYESERNGKAL